MKRYMLNKGLIALALLFAASGCKRVLDINEDPTKARLDQATPEVLFPTAVISSAGRIGGDLAILGGIWSQYWTQSASSNQYKTVDAYNLTRTDYNNPYIELYSGALNDLTLALKLAKEKQDWSYNLMCTVIYAYTYQVLVDLYDKVPYTEGLSEEFPSPKFDDGEAIYNDLLAQLDDALSKDFTAATSSTVTGNADLIFNSAKGDEMKLDEWKAFANTLKLKMYLRLVNKEPAKAEAGIRKMYTDGVQFLAQDAAVTQYIDQPDKSNPMYEFNIRRLNTRTNLRASETFLTWLKANNDERIGKYFRTSSLGGYVGIHQGDFSGFSSTYGRASVALQNPTDPVYFISLAESYFMQAEARLRYFGGDNSKALYDAGVIAAFAQQGLDGAPYVAANGKYAFPSAGTTAQKLEAIIVQKWASFPGSHALEAFFEKNRTDYPRTSPVYSTAPSYVPGQLVYSKNGVTGGKFPKRLVFPDVERSRNPNTPAEEPITKPVWWAIQ